MAETRYVSRQEAATKTKANLAIPYKKATGTAGPRTPTPSGQSGPTTEARPQNTSGQGPNPQATARGTGQPSQADQPTRDARQVIEGTGGKVDQNGCQRPPPSLPIRAILRQIATICTEGGFRRERISRNEPAV